MFLRCSVNAFSDFVRVGRMLMRLLLIFLLLHWSLDWQVWFFLVGNFLFLVLRFGWFWCNWAIGVLVSRGKIIFCKVNQGINKCISFFDLFNWWNFFLLYFFMLLLLFLLFLFDKCLVVGLYLLMKNCFLLFDGLYQLILAFRCRFELLYLLPFFDDGWS